MQARILDDENREVPENAKGSFWFRSSWAANKTAWIENGDLAYRDEEGNIFLCGRIDNMVISGEDNVYPVELETILLRHCDTAEAAVIGIADDEFGQRLKAIVILESGSMLDKKTLIDWLKQHCARYQIPAVVEFRHELPYTSLGKLNKKVLRDSRY